MLVMQLTINIVVIILDSVFAKSRWCLTAAIYRAQQWVNGAVGRCG